MLGEGLVGLAGWQLGLTLFSSYLWLSLSLGLALFLLVLECLMIWRSDSISQALTASWRGHLPLLVSFRVLTQLLLLALLALQHSYLVHFAGDVLALPLLVDVLLGTWLSVAALLAYGRVAAGWRVFALLALVVGLLLGEAVLALVVSWVQQPTAMMFNSLGYRLELTDVLTLLQQPLFISKWLHLVAASVVIGMAVIMAMSALGLRRDSNAAAHNRGFNWASRLGGAALLVLMLSGMSASSSSLNSALAVNPDQAKALQARIESGVLAQRALQALRDNDNSPAVQAEFEQHRADLGYAWLLLPIHKTIIDAEPRHIQLAVQSVLAQRSQLPVWSYRLMLFLGGFVGLWLVFGLLQVLMSGWTKRRLTWFIHGAPVAMVAALAGWLAMASSLRPWLVADLLPANLSVSSLTGKELWVGGLLVVLLNVALLVVAVYRYRANAAVEVAL